MAERRMVVLANATPLIALARCGLFDLLRLLYGRIVLPPAVYREVVIEGRGRPGAAESEAAIVAGWIEVLSPQDPEAVQRLQATFRLGDGESEVLALAQERGATLVLIDEELGFRRADAMGVTVLRTVGVLLQAKAHGLIATVKEPLDALRAEGFRLSHEAYREALRKAGEAP
jgi:uncharacterized protein